MMDRRDKLDNLLTCNSPKTIPLHQHTLNKQLTSWCAGIDEYREVEEEEQMQPRNKDYSTDRPLKLLVDQTMTQASKKILG
jgi:hypothetical protein